MFFYLKYRQILFFMYLFFNLQAKTLLLLHYSSIYWIEMYDNYTLQTFQVLLNLIPTP